MVGYQEKNYSLKDCSSGSGTAAQGVGDSLSLEVFQHHGDMALREMASGHDGVGCSLAWGS